MQDTFEPDARRTELYDQLYADFMNIRASVMGDWGLLASSRARLQPLERTATDNPDTIAFG